jgi:hypothetical protein
LVAALLFFWRRESTVRKGQDGFSTPPDYYSQSPAAQQGAIPKMEMYSDAPQTLSTPQQYAAPVEIGEPRPAPPVEIG